MTRVLISAGEASGDAYASRVVLALRAASPDLQIDAIGGREVRATGALMLEASERLSATGVVEPLRTLPRHVALRRRLARQLEAGRYDLAVLVDYPGFHLSLAAAAARAGVPVLYYIAPQLWAWGAWRLRRMQRHVRATAVVLPFEASFFHERGVRATFVGHPLLDRAPPAPREEARRALGVGDAAPVLGLFPGSRRHEIDRLWPVFRGAARLLTRVVPNLRVVLAGTETGSYPGGDGLTVWRGPASVVHRAADVGLCKSGTSTLEAALYDMPLVIAYRMHPVSFAVARRAVRVRHIGLVNLIAGREVAPEFLQRRAAPGSLADAALPLCDRHGIAAVRQREAFAEIRARLGTPGAARRVAEMALAMVA